LGPVRYLAALLGVGDQDVMRWFILVVLCSIRLQCFCCSPRRGSPMPGRGASG